jgi:hypothetical protein
MTTKHPVAGTKEEKRHWSKVQIYASCLRLDELFTGGGKKVGENRE